MQGAAADVAGKAASSAVDTISSDPKVRAPTFKPSKSHMYKTVWARVRDYSPLSGTLQTALGYICRNIYIVGGGGGRRGEGGLIRRRCHRIRPQGSKSNQIKSQPSNGIVQTASYTRLGCARIRDYSRLAGNLHTARNILGVYVRNICIS